MKVRKPILPNETKQLTRQLTEPTERGSSEYIEDATLVLFPYVGQCRRVVYTPKGDL